MLLFSSDRVQTKPGQCPELPDSETNCESDCENDYDCSGESKCCYNGCATICTNIAPESDSGQSPAGKFSQKLLQLRLATAIAIDEVYKRSFFSTESAPYISEDTDQYVEGDEGNLVSLHCIAYGNPTPTVAWRKDGETVILVWGCFERSFNTYNIYAFLCI